MTKRIFSLVLAVLLTGLVLLSTRLKADDKEKDEDRLRNSGEVIKEILNIPDDIPQSLLDKADCVVVIPSVLKAAASVCRLGRRRPTSSC